MAGILAPFMSFIGVGTSLAGTFAQLEGNTIEFQENLDKLNFAERINNENRKQAKSDLEFAQVQVGRNLMKQSVISRKFLGRQKAAFGARGVTITGSALDVLKETVSFAKMERDDILIEDQRLQNKIRGDLRRINLFDKRIVTARKNLSDASQIEALGIAIAGMGSFIGAGARSSGGG